MAITPPRPSTREAEEIRRRRRGRNLAMMLALFALVALFYAITIVKMTKS
ncbi:hypothetical protein J0H58_11800 [bacterium]|nr:hypothetical protein [Rhodospirillales bacterium]MBN8910123.1 hypothetical protein [Rhodospirillales bacterium]MBN9519184.1 hypothetical protein [bacterium]